MGSKSYWNDPTIAEQRAHELDRVLPTPAQGTQNKAETATHGRRTAGRGAECPETRAGRRAIADELSVARSSLS